MMSLEILREQLEKLNECTSEANVDQDFRGLGEMRRRICKIKGINVLELHS